MSQSFSKGSAAGEKKTIQVEGVSYTFCWCPPGEFVMGSPESETGRFDDEKQHTVRFSRGFWLLECEVTQEMWESVMGTTVEEQRAKSDSTTAPLGVGARYPMYYVNWEECQEFCRKLSRFTGEDVQLPTEAQWEYACRAGTEGPCAGTGRWDEMGWYRGNSNGTPHEVNQKSPNAWGLYDMHGNVWEWCSDWYDEAYYAESPDTDPEGPSSGSDRVIRGGSWCIGAPGCRSANRSGGNPESRNDLGIWSVLGDDYLGFRPVLIPAEE